MDYVPRKRTALTTDKKGYKKVSQAKTSEGWLPPVKTTPLIVSEERAFRVKVKVKEDLRTLHEFQFKIVRDDGTVIDHTLLKYITLWQRKIGSESARDSIGSAHGYDYYGEEDAQYWTYEDADEKGINGTWFYRKQELNYELKFNYDTKTQIWTVPFFRRKSPKVRRHKIFWAQFLVEDSVPITYRRPPESGGESEYNYKTEDWWREEDKMLSKFYVIRSPYYKALYTVFRIPSADFPDMDFYGYCGPPASKDYGRCHATTMGYRRVTVTSSIPYEIVYTTEGVPIGAYHGKHYPIPDSGRSIARTQAIAFIGWYTNEWVPGLGFVPLKIPGWVRAETSDGDVSNNIEANPINRRLMVYPPPYKMQTLVHIITVTYTGPDPFTLSIACSDGCAEFPLAWKIFRVLYSMHASPKLD